MSKSSTRASRMERRLPEHASMLAILVGLTACNAISDDDANDRQPAALAERCEVQPPVSPNFELELEWHWSGSSVLPQYNQVMMTPTVVDVSGDGIPDVIFHTFAGYNYQNDGVMRAISGDTGRELWTVTDPSLRVYPGASIAAGDIDKDGRVDLCTTSQGGRFICFEHTGALKFWNPSELAWRSIALADLEGDGHVELISGATVLDHTGAKKWEGSAGGGHYSFAADIDQDGLLEVITGHAVYRHDGSLKCRNTSVGHGFTGIANFDADPYGEIVVVWSGNVSLLDQDCQLLWTTAVPGGGGGAPNIADFDSDGQPEIGVAGRSYYVVFETNGSVRWKSATQDYSSMATGSSTFDFDGDGRSEVVYGDEVRLRIYDGTTGAVRAEIAHASGTLTENPVIVDVDGDDNAELVVASNNYTFPGPTGIRAFRDRRDAWVNTRPIWNQHPYSVTNVNDDGSIPAHPATNWLTPGLNTFRSNTQGTATLSPFAAADLTVVSVISECDHPAETRHLTARVRNHGEAAASAGLKVAFYRGNPAEGGTLLGVATLPRKLPAGEETTVELLLHPSPTGVAQVWAVADDDGTGTGRELECREDNNAATSESLDLTCVRNLPPVAMCRDVTVSADDTCHGNASVDAGSHDPDNYPAPLQLTQTPAGPFSLGSHPVSLTAYDGLESAMCTATVTVVDDTPPTLGLDKKLTLWSPNHKYHLVKLSDCAADAQDACSGTLPLDQYGRITHVTSDEVEDATGGGDGHTCADMVIVDSSSMRVRAERQGSQNGRVYTVHYVVTDHAGNPATGRCTVHVPHDQRGGRFTVDGGPAYCVGEGCPDERGRNPRCAP